MEGIIIVNKPQGMTSFDVVKYIRHKFKIKRVGHSGTLDPLATGILIILLGRYTKLFTQFSSFDKAYEATLELGVKTTTGDSLGEVIYKNNNYSHITKSQIEDIFKEFTGEISQIPPMFSALKYHGKKLYELARKGIDVPRPSRKVKLYDLQIRRFYLPYVDFYVLCSKGTYIRSLVQDIGERLGCGASITRIVRIGLGPFKLKDAVNLERVDESYIRKWEY